MNRKISIPETFRRWRALPPTVPFEQVISWVYAAPDVPKRRWWRWW